MVSVLPSRWYRGKDLQFSSRTVMKMSCPNVHKSFIYYVPLSMPIVSSVDSNPSQSFGDETSRSSLSDGNRRSTVKITDLGNGEPLKKKQLTPAFQANTPFPRSHRAPFHRRHPNATIPLSRSHSYSAQNGARAQIAGV